MIAESLASQLADQFKEVYIDGTWVVTNFQTQLQDVNFEEAFAKCGDHNSIAMLTFHIHYYLAGVLDAMKSGNLKIRDKYSFNMPTGMNANDWKEMKRKFSYTTEEMYQYIKNMDDDKIMAPFVEEKYGNNYKNIHGLIEHGYYHLGQLVLIKKLIRAQEGSK